MYNREKKIRIVKVLFFIHFSLLAALEIGQNKLSSFDPTNRASLIKFVKSRPSDSPSRLYDPIPKYIVVS